jgi:tRNA(Ile)-lysidine synthase
MSGRSLESIEAKIAALPNGALCVAFSGGIDSTVLLHRLTASPVARVRGLRAIHVDHGLHDDSARWAAHCVDIANALGVPIDVVRVEVKHGLGTGPEDAARRARFDVFEHRLHDDEFVVLAHHADDQAETVLLKLLRGAGPEGLGGMRALRPFANGYLWRPLLDVPKSALSAYAHQHNLRWIEDPSNADTRLRRNFIRHDILPRLAQRWPDVSVALSHSAEWARAVSDHIEDEARAALQHMRGDNPATLRWESWLALSDALRDAVLRLWLRGLNLPQPAFFHVVEIERQLRHAAADRSPCVGWTGCEIRRYRDFIYAMPPIVVDSAWQLAWNDGDLVLPDGSSLSLRSDGPRTALVVRNRRGGERIKPAGAHRRDVRLLLQEAGVPPWARAHLPLLYERDDLIAVADIAFSERGRELLANASTALVWTSTTPRAPLIPARR